MPNISIVDTISENLNKIMQESLILYETERNIDFNFKNFFLMLSESEKTCAVLKAYTMFAEIHVELLWVDAEERNKGYGTQLLKFLEEEYKNKGFNNINLFTYAFQAPAFYQKCGFKQEFIRENKRNPQLSKIHFVKFLEEER